jgi:hypothetical protein
VEFLGLVHCEIFGIGALRRCRGRHGGTARTGGRSECGAEYRRRGSAPVPAPTPPQCTDPKNFAMHQSQKFHRRSSFSCTPNLSVFTAFLKRSVGDPGRSAGDPGRSAGDPGRSAGDLARSAGDLARSAGDLARSAGDLARSPSNLEKRAAYPSECAIVLYSSASFNS